MKLTPEQIETLRQQYKIIYSTRVHVEDKLRAIIEKLVRGHEEMFITSRTKKENSFIAKATSEEKDYTDPINEITDITGIRIIVQYKDDATSIGEILRNKLIYDKDNSRDTRDEASSSTFGYSAIHIVASLPNDIISEHNLEAIDGQKFEIQIRTNLEHAWASKSREFSYNKDIREEYKRELNRLSALLEVADQAFMDLRDKVVNVQRSDHSLTAVESALTTDDVVDLLTAKEPVSNIVSILASSGLKVSDSARTEFANKILDILINQGAMSKGNAEDIIARNIIEIATACKFYMEATNMKSYPKDSLLVAGLAIVGNGDITPEQYSAGWNDRWKNGFLKASKEFKEWREANPA